MRARALRGPVAGSSRIELFGSTAACLVDSRWGRQATLFRYLAKQLMSCCEDEELWLEDEERVSKFLAALSPEFVKRWRDNFKSSATIPLHELLASQEHSESLGGLPGVQH